MSEDKKIETLAAALRERIKRGDFGTSGRLPTVTALAKEYKMARATMYQSLALLRSEGILTVRGTSYYAHYPLMRIPGSPLFDKFLTEQGLKPVTANLQEPEVIAAPADVAVVLGLKEGDDVIYRLRRQGTAEIHYRLQENWYPMDLAGDYLQEMKDDPDMNVAGRIRQDKGIALTTINDNIITRLPSSEEMALLNITRTTPILDVKKRFISQEGRVMVFIRSILVGAFFELSYEYPHQRKDK